MLRLRNFPSMHIFTTRTDTSLQHKIYNMSTYIKINWKYTSRTTQAYLIRRKLATRCRKNAYKYFYACIYVYRYVCIYTFIHIHRYIYIHKHIYIHVYMYLYIHSYTYTDIQICIHT